MADEPSGLLTDLSSTMDRLSRMPLNADTLREIGYSEARLLPGRGWCGLMRMMYTTGLFYGLDQCSYKGRYCYHSWLEAVEALRNWDGQGDPPGEWIKEKPSDRHGPGSAEWDYLNQREKDKLPKEGRSSA